jgi:hypothetical protein
LADHIAQCGAASLDVSTEALDEILRELDRERDLRNNHWHWCLESLGLVKISIGLPRRNGA